MSGTIRVLIVDREPHVRQLLRGRHAAKEGVRVVGGTLTVMHRLFGTDPREMEIFRIIAEGKSNAEIVRELGIDVQTVKNHVTAILRKLSRGDVIRATV